MAGLGVVCGVDDMLSGSIGSAVESIVVISAAGVMTSAGLRSLQAESVVMSKNVEANNET